MGVALSLSLLLINCCNNVSYRSCLSIILLVIVLEACCFLLLVINVGYGSCSFTISHQLLC